MARVLTVRLSNVKQLHISGITLQNITEQMRVVGQILLIERKAKLGIQLWIRDRQEQDFLQLLLPTSKHRICLDGSRLDTQLERSQTSLVGLLGHTVMNRFYTSMGMKTPYL